MKFAVIGAIFLGSIGVLLWISVAQGSIKRYSVTEMLEKRPSGEECRVDNSKILKIIKPGNPLKFTVSDVENESQILTVISKRLPPDNFKEGGQVAMRGVFDNSTNAFHAVELTTKCPTKYEAQPGGAAPYTPPKPGEKTTPAQPEGVQTP